MIVGVFHPGSGLGNQLFRYVATRTLAEDNGWDFGMIGPENFKGHFMNLDMGALIDMEYLLETGGKIIPISSLASFAEKRVDYAEIDIRGYDYGILAVQDNTIIDGEFQDEKYWGHRLPDISKWLHTEPLFMPNDLCIIGFRGGEYKYTEDLYLSKSYWQQAIGMMKAINPHMRFQAVTDDPEAAREMLPGEVKITHDVATDWRSIRAARYLIIANSSFYILPALLNNNVRKTIAPRFWARRNTGIWATSQNYYGKFTYI